MYPSYHFWSRLTHMTGTVRGAKNAKEASRHCFLSVISAAEIVHHIVLDIDRPLALGNTAGGGVASHLTSSGNSCIIFLYSAISRC